MKFLFPLLFLFLNAQSKELHFEQFVPTDVPFYVTVEDFQTAYNSFMNSQTKKVIDETRFVKAFVGVEEVKLILKFVANLEKTTGKSFDKLLPTIKKIGYAVISRGVSLLGVEFESSEIAKQVKDYIEENKVLDKSRVGIFGKLLLVGFGEDVRDKPLIKNLKEDSKKFPLLKSKVNPKKESIFAFSGSNSLSVRVDIGEKTFSTLSFINIENENGKKVLKSLQSIEFDSGKAPDNSIAAIMSGFDVSSITSDLKSWAKRDCKFAHDFFEKIADLKIGKALDKVKIYCVPLKTSKGQEHMWMIEAGKKEDVVKFLDSASNAGFLSDKGDGKYIVKIPSPRILNIFPLYYDRLYFDDNIYLASTFTNAIEYKRPKNYLYDDSSYRKLTNGQKGCFAVYVNWEECILQMRVHTDSIMHFVEPLLKTKGIAIKEFNIDKFSKLAGKSFDYIKADNDGLFLESLSENGLSILNLTMYGLIPRN